ncbi:MAG: outer membrane protein transport protein [Sulfuricurvum sp.]|uniref:OmpP1/FadL family transporter n=1 Tax=Sulfuricurvum sp. TaxID=2025608 RepID=UPI00262E90C7|nr:outer membrane protein transport protein [Sulfuricurvum sp.]MDD2828216.1 outer membrane protein transport protein [Sulfuricurvum sp.]MDD4949829.1 outer membrane protein transport protein [Sulfuricurvum sp.]
MRIITLSVLTAATLLAGGYKIPESSLNATALGAAYVANAHGADAAYYNPAAMVYNDDAGLLEVDATYIGLSKIHYASTSGAYNIDSKSESFLVPTLHFTSKKLGDNGARVGLSIVAPAGLSKRWDSQPAKSSAEEFTLQTIEVNPTMAVPLSNTMSLGVGFRIVRTDGVVKSNTGATQVSRDLTGDAIDYGYNLALNYRPLNNLSLAATYRSKISLDVEGSATLNYLPSAYPTHAAYSGPASVSIPLPAALNLATAYTFETETTVEAVYERTYWSAYKNLDFDYSGTPNAATVAFGTPIPKNYENTNTYRLGLTQKIDKLTAMAGIAYDESPTPEATLGYELPDSNAWIFSLGARYQITPSWNIGLAGLVDMKESREVHQSSGSNPVNGEFSNAKAYLVTAGIEYRF